MRRVRASYLTWRVTGLEEQTRYQDVDSKSVKLNSDFKVLLLLKTGASMSGKIPLETSNDIDELYAALQFKLSQEKSLTRSTAQLIAIKNGLVIAQEKSHELLSNSREGLCKICREESMHHCDVETGWSANCVFLKSNNCN